MIALTGYGQEATDIELANVAGFNHHFVKPVNPNELEKLLADAVRPALDSAPSNQPASAPAEA